MPCSFSQSYTFTDKRILALDMRQGQIVWEAPYNRIEGAKQFGRRIELSVIQDARRGNEIVPRIMDCNSLEVCSP